MPKLASLRGHFRYFDFNPYWVKNLRQAGRGRVVPYSYIMTMGTFLLLLFIIPLGGPNVGLGHRIFMTTIQCLSWVSFLGIPLYLFVQSLVDKTTGNAELSCITAMSPRRIMGGKVLKAATLVASIYSTAVPFLVFSYFLRGVDLVTILYLPACMFLKNMVLAVCAISMGACSYKPLSKILLSIQFGIPMSLFCIGMTSSIASYGFDPFALPFTIIAFLVIFFIYAVAYGNGIISARDFHRRTHPDAQPCQYEGESRAKASSGHTVRVEGEPSGAQDDPVVDTLPDSGPVLKPGSLPEPKTRFQKFLRYYDRTNPVFVKDFRQAARSKEIHGILQVLMVLFLLVVLYWSGEPAGGQSIFLIATGILGLVMFFILPAYVFIRTHLERADGVTDMMFITSMKPGDVMKGKVQFCMLLILVVYSTAQPFLIAIYFLKGTDLSTLAVLFPWIFFLTVLPSIAAIPLGYSRMNIVVKIISALLFIGFGVAYSQSLFSNSLGWIQAWAEYFLPLDFSNETFRVAVLFCLFYCLMYGLAYITGVASIGSIHRRSGIHDHQTGGEAG